MLRDSYSKSRKISKLNNKKTRWAKSWSSPSPIGHCASEHASDLVTLPIPLNSSPHNPHSISNPYTSLAKDYTALPTQFLLLTLDFLC